MTSCPDNMCTGKTICNKCLREEIRTYHWIAIDVLDDMGYRVIRKEEVLK